MTWLPLDLSGVPEPSRGAGWAVVVEVSRLRRSKDETALPSSGRYDDLTEKAATETYHGFCRELVRSRAKYSVRLLDSDGIERLAIISGHARLAADHRESVAYLGAVIAHYNRTGEAWFAPSVSPSAIVAQRAVIAEAKRRKLNPDAYGRQFRDVVEGAMVALGAAT